MFLIELPLVLEEIIINYKEEMELIDIRREHKQTFQASLNEINKITYSIVNDDSWRTYYEISVQCYGGLNHAYKMCDSEYELWIHTYDRTPTYADDLAYEAEKIITIYETINYIDIAKN